MILIQVIGITSNYNVDLNTKMFQYNLQKVFLKQKDKKNAHQWQHDSKFDKIFEDFFTYVVKKIFKKE